MRKIRITDNNRTGDGVFVMGRIINQLFPLREGETALSLPIALTAAAMERVQSCASARCLSQGGSNMKGKELFPMKLLLLGSLIVFALSSAVAKDKTSAKPVTVNLQDGQGKNVGTATLSKAPHGVKVSLNVHDLPA